MSDDISISKDGFAANNSVFVTSSNFSIAEPPEWFPRLPEIAERLGVKPVKSASHIGMLLTTKDGRSYDFVELITAFLDRIDSAVATFEQSIQAMTAPQPAQSGDLS